MKVLGRQHTDTVQSCSPFYFFWISSPIRDWIRQTNLSGFFIRHVCMCVVDFACFQFFAACRVGFLLFHLLIGFIRISFVLHCFDLANQAFSTFYTFLTQSMENSIGIYPINRQSQILSFIRTKQLNEESKMLQAASHPSVKFYLLKKPKDIYETIFKTYINANSR